LSVSASRVAEVAAQAVGIRCPSCMQFHNYSKIINSSRRFCTIFPRFSPTCHLSAHQWLLRGTCNMCYACASPTEQETPWVSHVVARARAAPW
jgi:hypothetical protein